MGNITGRWYSEPDEWYCAQPGIEEAEARVTVGRACPTDGRTGHDHGKFYLFVRQNGPWPQEVEGMELDALRAFCSIRHVSGDCPPAVLYHGTADHDVPFEESERFVAALHECGVEHLFLPLAGVDHVCKGADPQEFRNVVQQTADFMLSHLQEH